MPRLLRIRTLRRRQSLHDSDSTTILLRAFITVIPIGVRAARILIRMHVGPLTKATHYEIIPMIFCVRSHDGVCGAPGRRQKNRRRKRTTGTDFVSPELICHVHGYQISRPKIASQLHRPFASGVPRIVMRVYEFFHDLTSIFKHHVAITDIRVNR